MMEQTTMLCSVLVRRLRPGASYEDFHDAWRPEETFEVPIRVVNARSINDPREIISIGLMDLPKSELPRFLEGIAESEAKRHERIAQIIESTIHAGIYEVTDDENLS